MSLGTLLFQSHTFKDVCLATSDGALVFAHKCVLAIGSEYFAALFQLPYDDDTAKRTVWNGCSCSVPVYAIPFSAIAIRQIIEFFYTGEAPMLDGSNVCDVLMCSEFLLVPAIQAHCEAFLAEYISSDNVLAILMHSYASGAPASEVATRDKPSVQDPSQQSLRCRCKAYLSQKSASMLLDKKFVQNLTLDELKFWLSLTFDSQDRTPVDSAGTESSVGASQADSGAASPVMVARVPEIDVFLALEFWCLENVRSLDDVCELIRFPCLTPDQIKNFVLTSKVLSPSIEKRLEKRVWDPVLAANLSRMYTGSSLGPLPSGIQKNLPLDHLTARGWIVAYCQSFSHPTPSDIISRQCEGKYVCIAARSKRTPHLLHLCAMCDRRKLLDISDAHVTSSATLLNGAYWYHSAMYAVGFSDQPTVKLRRADVLGGENRLSIHIDGKNGGYRVGSFDSDSDLEEFEKLVLWSNWN
eukprot:ANDGO_00232.mRNA.1 Kelch repeat and BTB domain-containing protein 2